MNTDETPKSKESKESEAAEVMESEMENRDQVRHVDERDEQQDLNQGMATGTHDPRHLGVKWSPSYRTHGKRANPKVVPEKQKTDSE